MEHLSRSSYTHTQYVLVYYAAYKDILRLFYDFHDSAATLIFHNTQYALNRRSILKLRRS